MEEKLNLIQKLAKIRAISDVAQRNKKGYNYTYADITAILANVTAGMKKYRVSLIPSIVPGTSSITQNVITNTKVDKLGKSYEQVSTEMLYSAEMVFRWVNEEDASDYIEVPWFVTGSQSDPSQAMGGGLTYTTRYFLTSYFQIAQPDTDVDAYRSKQKEAEKAEDRAIAEGIVDQIDTIIKKYVSENAEKRDEVKKFLEKYVPNSKPKGNYRAIKDPQLAARLLEDFNKQYIKENK